LARWLGSRTAADWRAMFDKLDDQQIWALAETMRQANTP
jgi:hypothetical protein